MGTTAVLLESLFSLPRERLLVREGRRLRGALSASSSPSSAHAVAEVFLFRPGGGLRCASIPATIPARGCPPRKARGAVRSTHALLSQKPWQERGTISRISLAGRFAEGHRACWEPSPLDHVNLTSPSLPPHVSLMVSLMVSLHVLHTMLAFFKSPALCDVPHRVPNAASAACPLGLPVEPGGRSHRPRYAGPRRARRARSRQRGTRRACPSRR